MLHGGEAGWVLLALVTVWEWGGPLEAVVAGPRQSNKKFSGGQRWGSLAQCSPSAVHGGLITIAQSPSYPHFIEIEERVLLFQGHTLG